MMPACEKCWADSARPNGDHAEEYARLLNERQCTPEEQAGPKATECPRCHRATVHQYAKVCTICGEEPL